MIRSLTYLFLLIVFIGLSGCRAGSQNHYNFNFPTEGFRLSSQLDEISGLHYYSDSIILAVQDEKGILYFLNSKNGGIMDTYLFGKEGDYEGVTANKELVYVLKSNGDITVVDRKNSTKQIFEFKNSKGFDFEGICLDKENKRLLVACKTHDDKDKNDHLRIYGFDLTTMAYEKSPVFKIPKKNITKHFNPSAIAIHPNGNIYVLSSTAKLLVTLSPSGEILRKDALLKDIFNQPEGITFSANGDLYISNEKKSKYPTLLKFNAK